MTIIEWPRSERPQEKLLAAGADRLSDSELLALLLYNGSRGKPATVIARELLSTFGGLAALFAADQQTQGRQAGLGPTKVARLQAVRELVQRVLFEKVQASDPLTSSAATRRYLLARFRQSEHEIFSTLFLNNQHHVVKFEELFRGTIDGAAVYPREVVKRCLFHNAAAVIFAHNHPSGLAEPSSADIAITKRLQAALATIDVRVLDHLIIGANEVVSLAERSQI